MRNKVLVKIALTILVLIVVIANISTCFATTPANFDFGGFNKTADSSLTNPVRDAAGAILSVVRIVGTGVAIIILAVVGMKYMIASPGDRADFKKAAIQYVIGAVIVFGASNILTILIPVFRSIMGIE